MCNMLVSGLLIVLQGFLASSLKPQSSLETAVSYYGFIIHVKFRHWDLGLVSSV